MEMQKKSGLFLLTQAAMIAAVYVVLTLLAAGFGLANGAIQVRFSEALTVLPYFTNAAVPGLSIGCLLSNLLTGAPWPDIVFGTLATFLGAVGSCLLRKRRLFVSLPPIAANALLIPPVLKFAYGIPGSLPYFAATVGIGEVICCLLFGQILISALLPFRQTLFPQK